MASRKKPAPKKATKTTKKKEEANIPLEKLEEAVRNFEMILR